MGDDEWTFATFKTYVDRSLAMHEVLDQQRHSAQNEAVEKALTSLDRRFESMNEFRAQLDIQARDFIPRREYEVQHQALTDRVYSVELWRSRILGIGAVAALAIGTFGYLIAKAIG